LRDVSERLAGAGDRIPVSTLARIEQGKLDPGIRRLHLLLRLYEVSPHLVADLVELESLAVEPPVSRDLETLYREGVEYWKKGDIGHGLAYLFAVRELVPDGEPARLLRQRAHLGFAIAARNLGKLRLARQIVDDLLCEPPHPELVVRVLVLASSLWRGLGSLDVAVALVRRASERLDADDQTAAALVLHQEAKLLLETGGIEEATRVLDRAVGRYRDQKDRYNELRALVLRIGLLEQAGRLDEAFGCAREVIAAAERLGFARLGISGRLELGRLLVKTGALDEGVRVLREGLGQAVLLDDRYTEFLAHYGLWQAHEAAGDRDRARFEREAARYFVRFIDEQSIEAEAVRQLLVE
jgi:tetratricopeptide (TPR) repeat protein